MRVPRFNPKKLGIVSIVLGVAMFVTELAWQPVFTLPISDGFGFPVWILALIYGALQLYIWQATQQRLPLTHEEVVIWGPRLEEATPTMLEMYQGEHKVSEIADRVEKSYGIPPEITLRYIIALAKHLKAGIDTEDMEPEEPEDR